MANNRLFLIHRPTGQAVFLGKRMGWGWYAVPDDIKKHLGALFALVEGGAGGDNDIPASQDDFALAMEDVTEAPYCDEILAYGFHNKETGLRQLDVASKAGVDTVPELG